MKKIMLLLLAVSLGVGSVSPGLGSWWRGRQARKSSTGHAGGKNSGHIVRDMGGPSAGAGSGVSASGRRSSVLYAAPSISADYGARELADRRFATARSYEHVSKIKTKLEESCRDFLDALSHRICGKDFSHDDADVHRYTIKQAYYSRLNGLTRKMLPQKSLWERDITSDVFEFAQREPDFVHLLLDLNEAVYNHDKCGFSENAVNVAMARVDRAWERLNNKVLLDDSILAFLSSNVYSPERPISKAGELSGNRISREPIDITWWTKNLRTKIAREGRPQDAMRVADGDQHHSRNGYKADHYQPSPGGGARFDESDSGRWGPARHSMVAYPALEHPSDHFHVRGMVDRTD